MQEHIITVIVVLFICLGLLYLESSSRDELDYLLWVTSGPTHPVLQCCCNCLWQLFGSPPSATDDFGSPATCMHSADCSSSPQGHGRGDGELRQLCCGLFTAEIIITRLVNVSKCLFAQFPLSTSPPSDTAGSGSPAGCILLTAPLHLKGAEQLVLLQFVVRPVHGLSLIHI